MTDEKNYTIEPGQTWKVCRFQPEDAPGVARLFQVVYGDGYPVKTYTVPEQLIEANAAMHVISIVAKTPCGDIVAHSSLFNSAPHRKVYESGAGLIHPAYRGTFKLFVKLISYGVDLAETLPEVAVVFGETVCNHTTSQKLMVKLAFIDTALEVDLMPAEAYSQEASATGRVSALLCFKVFQPSHQTVYVPQVYAGTFAFFYAGLEQERNFLCASNEVSVDVSSITHEVFDFAGVVRIAVHTPGRDFADRMQTLEKNLEAQGVLVFQVWLNLADPGNGSAVETLRRRGYFIGGVLLHWFGGDGLLMQKILKTPDWEGIHIYSERSAKILDMVRKDWQRSLDETN